MNEIYVSTDIETDGPIPGPNSMLSFGSAAFLFEGPAKWSVVSTFSANLHSLPGADQDPDTMAWWATQPEAWAACRKDALVPSLAMDRYVRWLKELPGNLYSLVTHLALISCLFTGT